MNETQIVFRQFGIHDLEKYMFLGVPVEWDEGVLDKLAFQVKADMEHRLRNKSLEFLSRRNGFYLLMRKSFQFMEGAIWRHTFSEMGPDEPNPSEVTRSLSQWFDNYAEIESRIAREFTFESLGDYRNHGEHHPPTTARIAKIVAALRKSLAAHFKNDGLPDVPALHAALRELNA